MRNNLLSSTRPVSEPERIRHTNYPVSKTMLPTITIPIAIITIGIIILAPLKFSTFDMKALGDVFNKRLNKLNH